MGRMSSNALADTRPPAIFLMGPTASGKTALACALVGVLPLQLVSVDSALVYRGMDIGAAKPDADTLARYPHELVDIRDPAQPYSAAMFREDALAAMTRITAAQRVPLLVGGTGLYFRALQYGLSKMPAADAALRARLAGEAQQHGWPALHARLAVRDPQAAARIRPNDAQRIQRALEVIELTGRPLSQQQDSACARLPWRLLKIALVSTDRDALRERIAQRFDGMLQAGFLDEVRRLRARGDLDPELPAVRAVGYRQAWQHLQGDTAAETFRERAIFASNQLAKRQRTWLRSAVDARTFDPGCDGTPGSITHAIALFLGRAAKLPGK